MVDPPSVVAALATAAFPHSGRRLIDQLVAADPTFEDRLASDPVLAGGVVAVADASRSLARTGATRPTLFDVITESELLAERDFAAHTPGVERALADADPIGALRSWRQPEFLRIAVKDLLGYADLVEVGRELASLGDACLFGALQVAAPTEPFAVLGMGKLGGRELNYASDVDIVFVHRGDGAEAKRAARIVMRVMTDPRPNGILFRTDVDLRPEGPQGVLSRTPDSYGAYFERWAHAWERQAYIKMRYVAGDVEVSNELFDRVRSFVWNADLDPDAVAQLRRLKGRSESERAKPSDVKLGPGGIRDIEFSVQLLQLVHGRADRGLRSPNTLVALDQLLRAGLVDDRDANALADAYVHLRTVEHRLQLRDERQTHTVPDDPADVDWLARVLGYRDSGMTSAAEAFSETHRRTRTAVRDLHDSLFHRPILDHIGGAAVDPATVGERLRALGFADPDVVAGVVDRLTAGLGRTARVMRQLLPVVLDELSVTPDPDLGLVRLGWISDGPSRSAAVAGALRDSPVAVRRLCQLLGSSRVVADWLRRHPDRLKALLTGGLIEERATGQELRASAAEAVAMRGDDAAVDDELRRFARRSELTVSVRDLLGLADVDSVGAELASIADAAMDAVVAALEPAVPFAVIGLGRYGGAELSYASDLDVVFVYEGSGSKVARDAVRVAQGVLRRLGGHTREGRVWEIDARLRPDGDKGMLAISLDGYRRYWTERALTWERQSLLKVRAVAGDPALGEAFTNAAAAFVHGADLTEDDIAEIRSLKRRVEAERADAGTSARDVKLGPGGLIDIDFTVQLLQLMHGGRHPEIRARATGPAIDRLVEVGLLSAADGRALGDARRFGERLRNRSYLHTGRPTSVLPDDPLEARVLGRSLQFLERPAQQLREEHSRLSTAAREVVERVFYGT